jgi:hypothetical protein
MRISSLTSASTTERYLGLTDVVADRDGFLREHRTIWTGLTWLEVSALALIGGIYNAFVFDDDILGTLQVHVKDNYTTYVANQVAPKIVAAVESTRPAQPVVPAAATDSSLIPQPAQAPLAP